MCSMRGEEKRGEAKRYLLAFLHADFALRVRRVVVFGDDEAEISCCAARWGRRGHGGRAGGRERRREEKSRCWALIREQCCVAWSYCAWITPGKRLPSCEDWGACEFPHKSKSCKQTRAPCKSLCTGVSEEVEPLPKRKKWTLAPNDLYIFYDTYITYYSTYTFQFENSCWKIFCLIQSYTCLSRDSN